MKAVILFFVWLSLVPEAQSRTPLTQAPRTLADVLSRIDPLTRVDFAEGGGDCRSHLDAWKGLNRYIRGLNPEALDVHGLEQDAEHGIQLLFGYRIRVRNAFAKAYQRGVLLPECVSTVREVFRNLRGLEDYLGQLGHRRALAEAWRSLRDFPQAPLNPSDATRVSRPALMPLIVFPRAIGPIPGPRYLPPSTLVNPRAASHAGGMAVRSGDVLLSRGNANVSALIARMADDDTQFSHLAFVYVEPKSRVAYTIEAHIEHGSILTPLSEWLKDGKVRTVVFRHPDARLAAEAARIMFERVRSGVRANHPVEYDFSFNMRDHSKLFCSEVVREGFEKASGGSVEVPAFPSRFSAHHRDLFDRMGITETESFLPEDIEMDPRFELLAEWRDFGNIAAAVRKDAILTAMYDWMERLGYRFHSTEWVSFKARFAKTLRDMGYLKDRMPTYMSLSAVETSILVDAGVAEIEELLEPRERAHRARTGRPFTFMDFERELGLIRAQVEASRGAYYSYFH